MTLSRPPRDFRHCPGRSVTALLTWRGSLIDVHYSFTSKTSDKLTKCKFIVANLANVFVPYERSANDSRVECIVNTLEL